MPYDLQQQQQMPISYLKHTLSLKTQKYTFYINNWVYQIINPN